MPKLYTVTDIALILNVHYNTVYQLIRTRQLKAIRIGRTLKIREDHLNEFLDNSLIN